MTDINISWTERDSDNAKMWWFAVKAPKAAVVAINPDSALYTVYTSAITTSLYKTWKDDRAEREGSGL